jgi:hypothetical protein
MTDWQKKSDAELAQQAKANNQCALQIIKRKAFQDSKEYKFDDDVEDIWEDLLETVSIRTWGITKNKRDEKNYGKWKND